MDHPLRKPCPCGCVTGYIVTANNQDVVRCSTCNRYQYNAPRTETGRAVRTVTTVHNGIKPNQRARILLRANGHCELCGAREGLHVGHLISVDAGIARGMTEAELNDDENLCAMCGECNLGIGKEVVPLRLAVSMALARIRNGDIKVEPPFDVN